MRGDEISIFSVETSIFKGSFQHIISLKKKYEARRGHNKIVKFMRSLSSQIDLSDVYSEFKLYSQMIIGRKEILRHSRIFKGLFARQLAQKDASQQADRSRSMVFYHPRA